MNSKHTPGPWTIEADTLTAHVGPDGEAFAAWSPEIQGPSGERVAEVKMFTPSMGHVSSMVQARANAALIAAAPDMLSALNAFITNAIWNGAEVGEPTRSVTLPTETVDRIVAAIAKATEPVKA